MERKWRNIGNFEKIGLRRQDVKLIMERYLEKNADILIGVDDPEVNQLIDVLVDAFSEVIEANNRKCFNDINVHLEKLSNASSLSKESLLRKRI